MPALPHSAALSPGPLHPQKVILSSKIAPRALSGVNSPDPLCARHALALAALVARDAPSLFIDHVAHLIQGNLDIFEATGARRGATKKGARSRPNAAHGPQGCWDSPAA